MVWLLDGKKSEERFSRLIQYQIIRASDRLTDRQTDRHLATTSRANKT